ncbi:hypothetical protein DMENIID0001_062190 [Sergentomyia squamirostris]
MSIGIAFIGTFATILPTNSALEVAKDLIQYGVSNNYVDQDYKLFAARQLRATDSPGTRLVAEIQNWPHWTTLDQEQKSCPD